MDKVGKEGVITVEESNTFGLELELTEGCVRQGATSRLLRDRHRAHGGRPRGLLRPVVNSKISGIKDPLLPLLEKVMQSGSRC